MKLANAKFLYGMRAESDDARTETHCGHGIDYKCGTDTVSVILKCI